MKRILLIAFSVFTFTASAQNYFVRGYSDVRFIPSGYSDLSGDGFFRSADGKYVMASTGSNWITVIRADENGMPLKTLKLFPPDTALYLSAKFSHITDAGNGAFYISGVKGEDTTFIARINASENIDWQIGFQGLKSSACEQLITTADNGALVLIRFSRTGYDYYYLLMKVNSLGTVQWQKKYKRTDGTDSRLVLRNLSEDAANGDIFLCGYIYDGVNTKGLAVKLNNTGNVLWSKKYETGSGVAIEGLNNGNLKMVVQKPLATYEPVGIVDMNASGEVTGAMAYDSIKGSVQSALIAKDGRTIFSGVNTYNVVQTDASNNIQFANSYFDSTGTFPSITSFAFTPDGGNALFGSYVFTFYDATTLLIKTNVDGSTIPQYLTPFNAIKKPATPSYSIVTIQDSSMNSYFNINFIYKEGNMVYDSLFGGIVSAPLVIAENHFSLFPNPASDEFTVSLPDRQAGGFQFSVGDEIRIVDVTGRIVERKVVSNLSQSARLGTHTLYNGIYFVQIISDKKSVTQKLIVHH